MFYNVLKYALVRCKYCHHFEKVKYKGTKKVNFGKRNIPNDSGRMKQEVTSPENECVLPFFKRGTTFVTS